MSTITSSKSHNNSNYFEHSKRHLYDDDVDEDNPFRIPPDEKIFSFKEEEKERKLEERERNK
jgi:hypothetical protein